ncbi:hypothetical protein T01_6720 [Trichinella spiralis]|uniref:SCP domain-containing protein n=1 Tax=Trichinella spiralis TaxID=6334 RepID=A0A0V1BB93_TRISP|nr:hypothetical protein T01_6720 [Trichinella spiralis]
MADAYQATAEAEHVASKQSPVSHLRKFKQSSAIKSQAARIIAGYCGTMTNCFLFFSALFALSQLSLQQGTPKPFNDLGKLMMVSVHNTVRGDATDQSNVQCLTNWDSTLESYAQGLANSCNRTAPANPPYGLAYSSEISEAIITPQSFVETLGNSFSLFYDPTTNQCDPADKTDCDTGRQIVWYQGDKVGCGRANCTGRDFVVCAYTFQSSLQTRPYSRDPLGPCANCPSDKTVCTARLCCIPDSDSSSTPSTSVTSCGEKPANLVNLVRFWSDALTQNYLVTSQSEISALSAQSRTSNLGAVGKIPLQTSTACPYLTPIYKLYAASATSNYYMIDSSLRQQRLTEGYTDQGVIGYAVPAQHLCNASVAIYEFYSPGNGIVQVAPSTAPGALAGATPVSFSEAEKINLFFNSDQVKCNIPFGIRGHCKFQWDASLEKYAQTMANSCSSIKMAESSAMKNFSNLFYRNYDCRANISEENLLKNHNQDVEIFWSEVEKLGCGRSICENGISIVCAYLTANNNSIMHVSLEMNKKNFQKETMCNSTASSSTLDNSLTTSHLHYLDKPLGSCGSVLNNLVNLHRFWSDRRTQNYLVTNPAEIERLRKRKKMIDLGIIGKLAFGPSLACPYLLPVYRLFARRATSNYYMVNRDLMKRRLQEGYVLKEIIGYAVSAQHLCGASMPMYEFYAKNSGIIQVEPATAIGALDGMFGNLSWQGIPNPFVGAEQAELVTYHNLYRADFTAQNSECFRGWQNKFARIAQQLANTCQRVRPDNITYGISFSNITTTEVSPINFVQDVWQDFQNIYTYNDDKCSTADNERCINGKQMFWYQAEYLGCGRAKCGDSDFGVCVYTYKANFHHRPFLYYPGSGPCIFCSSKKSSCITNLCCKPLVAGAKGSSGFDSCGSQPSELIPLVRLYNQPMSRNVLDTADYRILLWQITSGTSDLGIIGKVAKFNDESCPFLKPIYQLYSFHFNSNYYVIDKNLLKQRIADGWVPQGKIGYAVNGENVCNATIPVYEFFNSRYGILQVQNTTDISDLLARRKYPEYIWHGISFWIWEGGIAQ